MPTPRVPLLALPCLLALAPAAPRPAAPAIVGTALSATEINVVEMPESGSAVVGFRVVVYSGSAEDPKEKEGLASMTAAAIARTAGTEVAVETGKDVTIFTLEAPRDAAEIRFRDLARALVRPDLEGTTPGTLSQERRRALETLRGEPARLAREALDLVLYRGHPYAHPAEGTDSSVERITREEILSFHADHYRKGNLAVGLSGGIDSGLAVAVKRELAALPDGAPIRPPRPVTWLPRPRLILVEMEGAPGTWVAAGHPLNLTRAHPDYAPFVTALGWGREPREGVLPRRRETLLLQEEAAPSGAAPAIIRVLAGLSGRRGGPLPLERLDAAKREAAAARSAALAGASAALASHLDDYLYGCPGFDGRLASSLDAVTAEGALSALERHLHPDRVGIAAVTPDAKGAAGALLREGRVREQDIEIVRAQQLFR